MVVVSHQFKANAIEADLRAKAINSKGVRTSSRSINRDKDIVARSDLKSTASLQTPRVNLQPRLNEGVCRGGKLSAADHE